MTTLPAAFDLDAYLARIDYHGPRAPTQAVLEQVHLAHNTHVPFENLDTLLGRFTILNLEHLQDKMVRRRRGGNCLEQTTLLAAALETLGFTVFRHTARVRLGTTTLSPRTHVVLRVLVEGASWLADPGFGWNGLLHPLPLVENQESLHFDQRHRLQHRDDLWFLQVFLQESWHDVYSFALEACYPIDLEVINFWMKNKPNSPFVHTLMVQLPTLRGRYILQNRRLLIRNGEQVERRPQVDDEGLLGVLSSIFGLEFPPGTKFAFQGAQPSSEGKP